MKTIGVGAIALMLAIASSAHADEAQISRDIRCMAVVVVGSAVLMERSEPQMKTLGLVTGMSSLYFLGRIEGAVPPEALAARMRKEIEAMSRTEFQAEAKRCGAEIQETGERMKSLGADLQAAAREKGV